MSSDSIRDQVRTLVGQMSPLGAREAASTDRLVEDLGFDSLAMIELSLQLESAFDLKNIGQGDAADIVTVGDIEELVEGAVSDSAPAA